MLQDHVAAVATLSELDLRGPRTPCRLPHEHHDSDDIDQAGYVNQQLHNPLTSTNTRKIAESPRSGTSQAGSNIRARYGSTCPLWVD
ncbi:hypothetical protein, partial [Nostocoides jenkinsii]|uniref:hypothetical protein n=1 Tax=Nostocoides jenkinsii TaxID=330834 RepID=UPI001F27153E